MSLLGPCPGRAWADPPSASEVIPAAGLDVAAGVVVAYGTGAGGGGANGVPGLLSPNIPHGYSDVVSNT